MSITPNPAVACSSPCAGTTVCRKSSPRREILGRTISLNGYAMTVIGAAQTNFDGVDLGSRANVFVPIMMKTEMTPHSDGLKDRRRRLSWVTAYGRLKPGISTGQAQLSLQPFLHSIPAVEVEQPEFTRSDGRTQPATEFGHDREGASISADRSNLRSMGIETKTAQELVRHANSRITLDLYTRSASADKRVASGKPIEMLMGSVSAPSSVPLALKTPKGQSSSR